MLNFIVNLFYIILFIWQPPVNMVYISGNLFSPENCFEFNNHLPINKDIQPKQIAPPDIEAKRAAVLAEDGHLWLMVKAPEERQAIASITKLMTALVFLDHNPGWEKEYTITRNDIIEGGKINFFLGETIKIKDLFKASLIASDNGATLALVHSTGLSDQDFINAMNNKAKNLGLLQTEFVDPIGLSAGNLSNVKDVVRLAQVALNNPEIAHTVSLSSYSFQTIQGKEKILESTDWLLDSSSGTNFKAIGGKTGYTDQAGYCFVGRFQDNNGKSIIVAVLDAGSKNDRFLQAKTLANWAFNHCNW